MRRRRFMTTPASRRPEQAARKGCGKNGDAPPLRQAASMTFKEAVGLSQECGVSLDALAGAYLRIRESGGEQ